MAADADVAFVWPPRLDWLATEWGWSKRLRWIATSTVGVDWLLFPALVESDIVVTNSAGVFDGAMAEYALTLVSAICADLHTTIRLQHEHRWVHREITRLAGRQVLVAGAGGIGRAIASLLTRAGAEVKALGRHGREDPELGWIAPVSEFSALLPAADFVILVLPLTGGTRGLVGADELARMGGDAWLINLGRGALVDEPALVEALQRGAIGGAALDVFTGEPLRRRLAAVDAAQRDRVAAHVRGLPGLGARSCGPLPRPARALPGGGTAGQRRGQEARLHTRQLASRRAGSAGDDRDDRAGEFRHDPLGVTSRHRARPLP